MPKLFVSGSLDKYSPYAALKRVVDLTPEPKQLVVVESADHFFEGHLPEMQAAIQAWITKFFNPAQKVEAG